MTVQVSARGDGVATRFARSAAGLILAVAILPACDRLPEMAGGGRGDIISFGQRYFTDRSNIIGYLFRDQQTGGTNVEIKIGGTASGSFLFKCQTPWNIDAVHKATHVIRIHLNTQDDVDPLRMLEQGGLGGCRWVQ
jgi:hypothetical protein